MQVDADRNNLTDQRPHDCKPCLDLLPIELQLLAAYIHEFIQTWTLMLPPAASASAARSAFARSSENA